jgi:CDP-glucose 4,6-dehydratase
MGAMGRYWPQATWEPDVQANKESRESQLLKLCCDKALNFLNWHAVLSFEETIRLTAQWYRTYYDHGQGLMYDLTCSQIKDYQSRALAQGLPWAGS